MRFPSIDTRSTTLGALGLSIALALALGASGCGRDFEPFNLVNKLRVLAIQADPPAVAPGETAVLRALVYEPDGDEVSYRWSWCPLTTGSLGGFECAVSEAELRDLAESFVPGSGALVPSFDLGSEPEAAFDYSFSPVLMQGLCELLTSFEAPSFVSLPDCEESLVVSITLEVTAGDEAVTAIKELPVYFDEAGADNENPAIGEVTAALGDGGPAVLPEDGLATLLANRRHDLVVDVPIASAQVFQPSPTEDDPQPASRRESLFMTWFVTGGDTTDNRTTFIEDEIPLEELGSNRWLTPRDQPETTLFLVLQDERGGVGWTWRDVQLVED